MAQSVMDLVINITGNLTNFNSSIQQAQQGVNNLQGQAQQSAGGVSGAFGNAANLMKTALVGAAAAGAAAIVAIGVSAATTAVNMANDFQKATGKLQATLGATAEETKEYGEIAKKVFADNFGESIGEATEAVAEVKKALKGLKGDELKEATENAFRLKDAFGLEVGESVNAVKTLMEKFGLSSQQAFDFIAKGQQEGLNASGDFLDTINEYGVQFQGAGYKAEEFYSVLKTGQQGGTLGLDKAADLVKEFGLRIADGSTATRDALADIGIDADKLAEKLGSGKLSKAQALDIVREKLKGVKDETLRNNTAIALMGTQYEDLQGKAALSISATTTKMKDLEGSTKSIDAMYQDLGSLFQDAWRDVQVALMPVGEELLKVGKQYLPLVTNAIGSVVKMIPGFIQQGKAIGTQISPYIKMLSPILKDFGEVFKAVFGFIRDLIVNGVMPIVRTLAPVFEGVFKIIVTTLRVTLNVFSGVVKAITQLLNGDFSGAFETAKNTVLKVTVIIAKTVQDLGPKVMGALKNLGSLLVESGKQLIDGLVKGINAKAAQAVESVKNLGRNVLSGFRNILGIKSPSKEMEKNGKDIIDGLGIGLDKNSKAVIGKAQALGKSVNEAVRSGANVGAVTNLFGTAEKLLKALDGAKTAAEIAKAKAALNAFTKDNAAAASAIDAVREAQSRADRAASESEARRKKVEQDQEAARDKAKQEAERRKQEAEREAEQARQTARTKRDLVQAITDLTAKYQNLVKTGKITSDQTADYSRELRELRDSISDSGMASDKQIASLMAGATAYQKTAAAKAASLEKEKAAEDAKKKAEEARKSVLDKLRSSVKDLTDAELNAAIARVKGKDADKEKILSAEKEIRVNAALVDSKKLLAKYDSEGNKAQFENREQKLKTSLENELKAVGDNEEKKLAVIKKYQPQLLALEKERIESDKLGKLAALDEEYNKQIAANKKLGVDSTALTKEYTTLRKAIIEKAAMDSKQVEVTAAQQVKDAQEKINKEIEDRKKALEEVFKLSKKYADESKSNGLNNREQNLKQNYDEEIRLAGENEEKRLEVIKKYRPQFDALARERIEMEKAAKLEALDKEYQEQIESAKKSGADTAQLTKDYTSLRQSIITKAVQDTRQVEIDSAAAVEDATDKVTKSIQDKVKAIEEVRNLVRSITEEAASLNLGTTEDVIKNSYEAEIDAAEDNAEKLLEIEKKYQPLFLDVQKQRLESEEAAAIEKNTKEWDDAVKKAQDAGEDIQAVNAAYLNKQDALRSSFAQKYTNLEVDAANKVKAATDKVTKSVEDKAKALKAVNDLVKSILNETAGINLDTKDSVLKGSYEGEVEKAGESLQARLDVEKKYQPLFLALTLERLDAEGKAALSKLEEDRLKAVEEAEKAGADVAAVNAAYAAQKEALEGSYRQKRVTAETDSYKGVKAAQKALDDKAREDKEKADKEAADKKEKEEKEAAEKREKDAKEAAEKAKEAAEKEKKAREDVAAMDKQLSSQSYALSTELAQYKLNSIETEKAAKLVLAKTDEQKAAIELEYAKSTYEAKVELIQKQLDAKLAALEAELQAELAKDNITKEQQEKLRQQYQQRVTLVRNQAQLEIDGIKQVSATNDAANQKALSWTEILIKAIGQYRDYALQGIDLLFSGMTALGGMGSDVADQWKNDLSNMVNDIANIATKIMSGDWVGAVVAGLKAIFDWFNRNAKAAEEAAKRTAEFNKQFSIVDPSKFRSVETYTTGILFWQTTHYVEHINELGVSIAKTLEGGVLSGFTAGFAKYLETGNKADFLSALKDGIRKSVTDSIIQGVLNSSIIKDRLGPLLTDIADGMSKGLDVSGLIKQLGNELPNVVDEVTSKYGDLGKVLGEAFGNPIDEAAEKLKQLQELVKTTADGILNGIVSGMRTAAMAFLNGDADWKTKLYEGLRSTVVQAIVDGIVSAAMVKGLIGNLIDEIAQAIVDGKDTTALMTQLATQLGSLSDALVTALGPLKQTLDNIWPGNQETPSTPAPSVQTPAAPAMPSLPVGPSLPSAPSVGDLATPTTPTRTGGETVQKKEVTYNIEVEINVPERRDARQIANEVKKVLIRDIQGA